MSNKAKTPSTHKFAVLLTDESPELPAPIALREGMELRLASVSDLAGERMAEWKEAIGYFAWREREQQHLVCVNTAPAKRPDVLDAEHQALSRDCTLVWFAYQLARLRHPAYGTCVIAEGHATEGTAGVSLGLMQGWSNLHRLIRPNYTGDRQYFDLWRQEPKWLIDTGWPERVADCWRLLDGAHDADDALPALVDRGLDAYSVALRLNGVDHRLPYFVRSAESVLAIPRGQGRATFVARAMKFLPTITSDLYIGSADIAQYLGDIYQLRSDCVHGKDPASELAAEGKPIDLVAKYEYLAEALANATTRWALREHAYLRTMTRGALEAEWAAGNVPPI